MLISLSAKFVLFLSTALTTAGSTLYRPCCCTSLGILRRVGVGDRDLPEAGEPSRLLPTGVGVPSLCCDDDVVVVVVVVVIVDDVSVVDFSFLSDTM